MKNNFGTNISMTIFGESHGPCIGITLDGLPAGFKINLERIKEDMEKRKAKGSISTQRHEDDEVEIVSGFFNGYTTGTALTILIQNKNTQSKDYSDIQYRLRPGHADFSAYEKYHGFQDYRGGGHFSGRLTAPIVAAGSICRQILETKNILIGSHIEQLYALHDAPFSNNIDELKKQIQTLNKKEFATLDEQVAQNMEQAILEAKNEQDSIGGILESAIINLPAGIGEPFFDSIESILAHLLFSIPAVKGVSFGAGFQMASKKGSEANDAFIMNDTIQTKTNNNGGINGGISNGMPIIIHTCIKPTPSIYKTQETVDYKTKESQTLNIKGRHDPCILHRARIVVDSMIAFGILDLLMSSNANNILEKEIQHESQDHTI
ncbi:chorismate synthase [Faecalitalea cylindroides]|uniref:chorismate synthase n=2 Tax=Faecalitalea cylindroides TaxID=39483 RepID=UPI002493956A|nr:chorismate synthase [Faecalitalea cylindroides]